MCYMKRPHGGWAATAALVAALMTISACGTTPAFSRGGAPTSCPARAPSLAAAPAVGTTTPVLPGDAVTATICQYALLLTGSKAPSAPMRRIVLRGDAADGLRAVLTGTAPMTPPAAKCDRAAALLPFVQVIYFGYRDGRTVHAMVTFTSCELAVVTAADRFGTLPSPIQDDLFGYTLITQHDRGPGVPDLVGLPAMSAAVAARRGHFALSVDGQAVDPAEPFGTVIFQALPPGVPDAEPGPSSVTAVVSVDRAPDCRAGQLRLSYRAGGAGAGSDFGEIVFRNVAASPCRLPGPLRVTGFNAAGRSVTSAVTATVARPGVLGPDTPSLRDLAQPAPGTIIYALPLAAEYRDDATTPNGLCTERVTPLRWTVQLPGGPAIMVPNNDSGSPFRLLGSSAGLVTCRGRLGAESQVTFQG